MINHTTTSLTFSILLCLCRSNGDRSSWVHGSYHDNDNDEYNHEDVNEKIRNKNHLFLKELQTNENLHLTSLLQDDLSYLENDASMTMETVHHHQTETLNRILYGSGDGDGDGRVTIDNNGRYLEDDEDDDDMSLPTCIAPPSSSENGIVRTTHTTNTTNTTSLLPETTNFTGILLLEMIGRPTSVSDNETDIMELVILATYQNLSKCQQNGIIRQVNQVEIIPNIFGFSSGDRNRGDNNEDEDVIENDDTETNTSTSTRRHYRHKRRLVWEQNDDENDNGEHHHTLLWKTPNDYFEWNRRRYYESHHHHRSLQQQGTGTSTSNNNTANNNNTAGGGGSGINILRPVTQPFNWLVRLTGTCNGCALQPSLFDDISTNIGQRRQLLHLSSFHSMETMKDNKNNKEKDTMMTYKTTKNENLLSPPSPIRGGGGGGTTTSNSSGGEDEPQRRLMENESDTTTTTEICNCPGPKSEVFQQVLNDTIYQLVEEGIIESIDVIDDTPELIRTSPNKNKCGEDNDGNEIILQTFSASLVVTIKACLNQFLIQDQDDLEVLSPMEVIALAYQKSFNELNLLNGGHTCDPYARRLIDVTAMFKDEEDLEDLMEDTDAANTAACTGDNIPFISIRLNLKAECLGCDGILFESEEDNEDLGSETRHLLRKLKKDDNDEEELLNSYSDLFPFCFCPRGTPSRGIKASELFEIFNTTLDIFQQEGRGGNDFETVEVDEVSDAMVEPICGNGILDLPDEECDDGNTIDSDACTNNCTVAICGDGILTLDGSEECDDGNDIDTDECTNACLLFVYNSTINTNSTTNNTNITDFLSIPPTMSNTSNTTNSNITDFPSISPTMSTNNNTNSNTTYFPSISPTGSITNFTVPPTMSNSRSNITDVPSKTPTMAPSMTPTMLATAIPSVTPTAFSITTSPSFEPSTTLPSVTPTMTPSKFPSMAPSDDPSSKPSISPTTADPSGFPSPMPSTSPSHFPSMEPSGSPSHIPSIEPSVPPSHIPSMEPTESPTHIPSIEPSVSPSHIPSMEPTESPTHIPSMEPSASPSHIPSLNPSESPSSTDEPSHFPSIPPSATPTTPPPTFSPSAPPSYNICTSPKNPCGADGTCQVVYGTTQKSASINVGASSTTTSYTCTCNPDYFFNGVTCIPTDSTCQINGDGTTTCSCNVGFLGDGVTWCASETDCLGGNTCDVVLGSDPNNDSSTCTCRCYGPPNGTNECCRCDCSGTFFLCQQPSVFD